MRRMIAAWMLPVLFIPVLLFGQGTYGRRTRGANTANAGIYGGPAVTFQGKVKSLNKKELRIDVDSEDESMLFHISRKTHFLKDGKEIKPAEIAVGTVVAVDTAREPDQTLSALNVIVNPPKPKTSDQ